MNNQSVKVGIIGASGYTGLELMRLLVSHPRFEVFVVTGNSEAGRAVGDLYPSLSLHQPYANLAFRNFDEARADLDCCDLLFCCLPHGESMKILPSLNNQFVIDLSSDFRLNTSAEYEQWYGKPHLDEAELSEWCYGCPELNKVAVLKSSRIANPGCFATAISLALAPIVKHGLYTGSIVADGVSGLSGAGKSLNPKLHFAHAYEDVTAYKIGTHQHTGEIEMILSTLSPAGEVRPKISMTAHLAPMSRGIHATCSAQMSQAAVGLSQVQLIQMYVDFYKGCPFIKVTDSPPSTKTVRGSNVFLVYPTINVRTGRIITVSVIDNLIKGAAGLALQNANLLFGFDETMGLNQVGLYP